MFRHLCRPSSGCTPCYHTENYTIFIDSVLSTRYRSQLQMKIIAFFWRFADRASQYIYRFANRASQYIYRFADRAS